MSLLERILYLFRRRRFDTELDAEVQFHIETCADELEAGGMERRKAIAQARRQFGSAARMGEETRAAWQFGWLEYLASDLRYAARAFGRTPSFAVTAIACLALGIGANTTIFSIASEVLFSRPSVADPDTMAHLRIGGASHIPMREYRFLRDAKIFDGLAGENEEAEVNWRNGDRTDRLFGVRTTDNFFDVTRMPVAMGRTFQAGETDAVVISYNLWNSRLGADPNVLGRKMILDGRAYQVAGVLPRDHRTVTGFGFSPDLYFPVANDKTNVALFARLPQGMTRAEAADRLKAACQRMDEAFAVKVDPWARRAKVEAIGGLEHLQSENLMPIAAFFGMLMVVVALVLSIACANVASLLMARASSRSRELAIRLSIGAGRGRILRQLLAESLLLAVCGTGAGLALNLLVTAWISRLRLPLPLPLQYIIEPNWPLLGYSVLVGLGSCLAAGVMPAIQGTRAGLNLALKRDEHQAARAGWSFRNLLVTGQLAVSIVLLCAGFLFLRNLVHASSVRPGFDIEHTVWAHLRLVPEQYQKPGKSAALVAEGLDRLRNLPGVDSAAIARIVPLNDNILNGTLVHTDLSATPRHVTFHSNYVGAGYFRVMQIGILRGREFQVTDAKAVILNENMARTLFGDTDPIGHTITWDAGTLQVIGVVQNSKYFTLGEENANGYYEPYVRREGATANLHFLVRAVGRPEAMVPAIQAAIGSLDTTAALEVKPMSQALAFAMLPSRVGAAILGAMGLLGLGLAAIGLYGVLLFAVSRRTREIGLRVALGASPASVLGIVLRQSVRLAGSGIVAGLALAYLAVRPLTMFLIPEVRPTDPGNFAIVGATLSLVALVATLAPAVRALRVDPVVALRHE
jgi:predicted permease